THPAETGTGAAERLAGQIPQQMRVPKLPVRNSETPATGLPLASCLLVGEEEADVAFASRVFEAAEVVAVNGIDNVVVRDGHPVLRIDDLPVVRHTRLKSNPRQTKFLFRKLKCLFRHFNLCEARTHVLPGKEQIRSRLLLNARELDFRRPDARFGKVFVRLNPEAVKDREC